MLTDKLFIVLLLIVLDHFKTNSLSLIDEHESYKNISSRNFEKNQNNINEDETMNHSRCGSKSNKIDYTKCK